MNTFHKLRLFLGIVILSTSCGPVHRLTRVRKIPREYSLNYCTGEVRAPKTDLNREPWIVYSDREKNFTLINAGGKVKAEDADFLDPFLVIKKKGEYLRLIKYTPDILKNGRLDYKKAEYRGWMHKSRLLLNRQSVTDIASGRKIKTLTLVADTVPLADPDKYFVPDSIKTYGDPEFNRVTATVAHYSIVYRLKLSENGDRTLISRKAGIKPETVKNDVPGWMDNSLIRDAGTGLHVDLSTVPGDSLRFALKKERRISLSEDMAESVRLLSGRHKTLRYSPVSQYSTRGGLTVFGTRAVAPLFDYGNNYVFNVNGERITRKAFGNLSRELKKIRVSFVFEGREQTVERFPQIVNAIQSLQPLFERDGTAEYRFNCVMAFDDERTDSLTATATYSEFSDLLNYLSLKATLKDRLRPVELDGQWPGLNMAVDLLDGESGATGLIVLIGDRGYASDRVAPALVDKLRRSNCRICAFQIHAGNGDVYNNFVLSVENMIASYADDLLESRKNLFVSAGQIRHANRYRETDAGKNGFRLDFPENSITQGCLFFPQKHETLTLEYMADEIDTVVRQIKADNGDIIRRMDNAFHSSGNNRTLFDSLYVRNFGLSGIRTPAKTLLSMFGVTAPGWYLPGKAVVPTGGVNGRPDYYLLLSETEMKELKEFVESLAEIGVDLKYRAEAEKAGKKACNCPEDDPFAETETLKTSADTLPPVYAGTKKVRRHLYRLYMRTIKYCRLCRERTGELKSLTLAQAHYRITGCPTSAGMLNRIALRDIKNKKRLPDVALDGLIGYFESKLPDLERAERFESGGEVYYWLDKKYLP